MRATFVGWGVVCSFYGSLVILTTSRGVLMKSRVFLVMSRVVMVTSRVVMVTMQGWLDLYDILQNNTYRFLKVAHTLLHFRNIPGSRFNVHDSGYNIPGSRFNVHHFPDNHV